MLRLALSLTLALALPATAQEAPSYWRVVDVASDDTLNVRAAPDAYAEDIGDLPHDATGIEVAAKDASGKWGRIVWQERDGWIATRFLAPDPQATIGGTTLPVGLLCGGTEPFWSLRLSETGAAYSDAAGEAHALSLSGALTPQARGDYPVVMSHNGTTAAGITFVEPGMCSDGMSDRTYPWRMYFVFSTAQGQTMLQGCCQLPLEIGSH